MLLSKEFYYKCSPNYQNVIDKLEQKITDIEGQDGVDRKTLNQQKQAVVLQFSNEYHVPIEYFSRYCNICVQDDYDFLTEVGYPEVYICLRHRRNFDLLSKAKEDLFKYLYIMDFKKTNIDIQHIRHFSPMERDLNYPHSHLQEFFRNFEQYSSCPPSKKLVQRYEKMKVLYSKIKAAEDDIEKWFELLLEADIDEFVIQNVENRIAINLHDVKLWQTYIDYLKRIDPKRMLLWFSKYCRFFLDDFKMKENYKAEMEEYGHAIELPWSNLFDFEESFVFMDQSENNNLDDDMESTDNENILFDDKSQVQSDENMDDGNKSRVSESEIHTMQHFCAKFFDTAKHQNFALPRPIMYYILKNSDHIVLQKLFKSCKYFFAEKFTPICYSLVETHKETSYDNEKLSLNYKDIKKRLSQNTFVTTVISLGLYSPRNFMSKEIIPRLSRSEAKYIELWNQNLSFDDLKFLIEHGNVIELFLKNCDIQEEADGNLVELEKIMEFLPNIEKFDLYPVKCNSNTGHALSNLKFNSKINYLCLANINGESFDPNEFRKFCTANQAQSFSLIMAFDIDKSLLFEFVSVMFEYAESFEDTDFKCYFN